MRKALFKIREKMRRREFILGTNTTFNDACVTELLGDCGFDFIWIDMEHTTITKDSAVQHERNQAAPARFRQREESMAARIRGKFIEQPPIKTNVVNRAQKYSETLDRDSIGAGRDAKRQM